MISDPKSEEYKHIPVSLKPFIGEIDLGRCLATGRIEAVLAGGENYLGSCPLHYEWIKKIHDQCEKYDVQLIFGQTGNVFVKDGRNTEYAAVQIR